MPIRPPVLNLPFNVVRASHAELGMRDLAHSRLFNVDCEPAPETQLIVSW